MKRATIISSVLAVLLTVGGIPALAQHGGGGGGKGPGGPPSTPGSDRSKGNSDTRGASSNTNSGQKTPSELLTQNTKLASKIHDLTGMDAKQACLGFKNLGQCVAAAHVAHNLGGSCTFTKLKGAVTGSPSESLGQAIHGCNPHVDAKAEAKKGKKQADDDLKES